MLLTTKFLLSLCQQWCKHVAIDLSDMCRDIFFFAGTISASPISPFQASLSSHNATSIYSWFSVRSLTPRATLVSIWLMSLVHLSSNYWVCWLLHFSSENGKIILENRLIFFSEIFWLDLGTIIIISLRLECFTKYDNGNMLYRP